jgi:hypothetical protein
LVAAITRTFTVTFSELPTRATCRVSSTRNRRTCRSSGISVISSRNSVPPCARSKYPACWRVAPVKLPRSWPNSSLSIRLGDTAPQLSARYGPFARADSACSWLAMSSLPVPLSPMISTVTSAGPTRAIVRASLCICGDSPISDDVAPAFAAGARKARERAIELAAVDRLGQVIARAPAQRVDARLDRTRGR